MFRRHLKAIVSFPAGLVVLVCLLAIPAILTESQTLMAWGSAAGKPFAVGCVLLAITLVFYAGREREMKSEWSALAPALAASTVVADHWNNLAAQWINIPPSPGITVWWVADIILGIVFLAGICFLGAALAARWMERHPTTGRPKGFGHEAAAVAILIALIWELNAIGWVISWKVVGRLPTDLDATPTQSALGSGIVLFGLLTSWLVIALVGWRGADRLSRWRLLALWSVWVCLDSWMRDLHWVLPRINPYERTWALAIGVEAGILAILYGRLVVQRLWIRASPPLTV